MADFLDIVSFRDRGAGQKPFAVKIGSAKKNQDGSIDLYFDALPAPSLDKSGQVRVTARVSERRERQQTGSGGGRQYQAPRNNNSDGDMDSEIPF